METVQRFVDGPWRHAARAREACNQNDWHAFQTEQMPRPGFHRPLLRRSYDRCATRCVELFRGPRKEPFMVVPIWVCNAFEEESDDWFVAHALQLNPFGESRGDGAYHRA